MFGGSFGEIINLLFFILHWRNLPCEIAAEFVGDIFGKKILVKPNLIFGENAPKNQLQAAPFSKCAIDTSQEPCLL